MANSKITKYQKVILRDMIALNPELTSHTNEETTIVFWDKPNCNTVEFAVSVASPDEQKFRAKVGKFYAYERFLNGQTVKMARTDFYTMMYNCYDMF